MKKFLNIFFVTLGVIFFLLILVGTYFFVADPLGLKPLLYGNADISEESRIGEDKNPALSSSQEKTLETVGIDPASVPSSFTPEQEACFVSVLGQARVDEIKAGDSPSIAEALQAKACL